MGLSAHDQALLNAYQVTHGHPSVPVPAPGATFGPPDPALLKANNPLLPPPKPAPARAPAKRQQPQLSDGKMSPGASWFAQHVINPVVGGLETVEQHTLGAGARLVGNHDPGAALHTLVHGESEAQLQADRHAMALQFLAGIRRHPISKAEYDALPGWKKALIETATQGALDPLSYAGGAGRTVEAARVLGLGKAAKGTDAIVRVLSRARTTADKAKAADNLGSRTLRRVAGGGPLNRYGEVMQAAHSQAYEAARAQGASVLKAHAAGQEAALQAAQYGRQLATHRSFGKAMGQRAGDYMFPKGLNQAQRMEAMHRIESTVVGPHGPLRPYTPVLQSPKIEALITQAVKNNRAVQDRVLETIKAHGLVEKMVDPDTGEEIDKVVDPKHFVSRPGWMEAPDHVMSHPSAGSGSGIRKDTLAKRIKREDPRPLAIQIAEGKKLNPEYDPGQAAENQVGARYGSVRAIQALQGSKKLGLIAEEPKPGFLKPSDTKASVRNFGLKSMDETILGEDVHVHPALAHLIDDINGTARGDRTLLSSIMDPLNKAARMLYTTNLPIHAGPNLGGNTLREILSGNINPVAGLRGVLSKETGKEVERTGAGLPWIDPRPRAARMGNRGQLSPMQKISSVVEEPYEALNSRPLFKHIQPAYERFAYAGAKGAGHSEAKAADVARSVVGDPENMGAVDNLAGHLYPFAGWRKSNMLRWAAALSKNPSIMTAPHNAIRAHNEQMGYGYDTKDDNSLLPGIHLDKQGTVLHQMSPADFGLGIENAASMAGQGKGQSEQSLAAKIFRDMNLVPSYALRAALTASTPPHTPYPGDPALYDRSKPLSERLKAIVGDLGQYKPISGKLPGALVGADVSTPTVKPPHSKAESREYFRMMADAKRSLKFAAAGDIAQGTIWLDGAFKRAEKAGPGAADALQQWLAQNEYRATLKPQATTVKPPMSSASDKALLDRFLKAHPQ